jgi:hypothetical protein
MCIEQRISPAKVSSSEFISAFETEYNRIIHLLQSSATCSSTYLKIVKDCCACEEVKRDFLQAWFAESHNNVVEPLLSNDHLTYHEAQKWILNHPSNHRSACGASSKNSKPQHEANGISSPNGKKDKKKKKGSFSASNSASKDCNWYHKHSPGTMLGHIWTLWKEIKSRRDRNRVEIAAPVQEVANTVSYNSSK